MQSEVERDSQKESLSPKQLKALVRDYLRSQSLDEALAEVLFPGVVERIYFLVAPVDGGNYRFEVDPLREYFAARHLYETAQQAPAADDKPGSLVDRFAGMARNATWLDVIRFYAGCYSEGAAPSLIDGLQELAAENAFKLTSYPHYLASTLQADGVFSAGPMSNRRTSEFVLKAVKERRVLGPSPGADSPAQTPVSIPDQLSQTTLLDYGFEELPVRSAPTMPKSCAFTSTPTAPKTNVWRAGRQPSAARRMPRSPRGSPSSHSLALTGVGRRKPSNRCCATSRSTGTRRRRSCDWATPVFWKAAMRRRNLPWRPSSTASASPRAPARPPPSAS
jgi:hypothetical protein